MASNSKQRNQQAKKQKSFWTPTTIGVSVAMVVLVAALGATFFKKTPENASADSVAASSSPSAARSRASRIRTPLTEFPEGVMSSQIEMTTGKPVRLDQFAGKVVVVNLWATWCGPCRIEIPHLIQLSKEFKSKGVEVLGLTTEEKTEETAEAVTEFVKSFEIPYSVGWANEPLQRALLGNSPSIPQSVIVGKDGKLFRHLIGFNRALTPPQLRAAVEEALAK